MDFYSFIEGPLLWTAFLIFVIGMSTRAIFFLTAVLKAGRPEKGPGSSIFALAFRSFFPFHMVAINKALYTMLRYLFHICLFVVPIWLIDHVMLWSESRFGWEWTPLPDPWAEAMTIIFLCLAGYFLLRRILFPAVRRNSSASDFILLIISVIPFLSGYFLTHNTPDALGLLDNHMWTIHVLSGEGMLVVAAFLFFRTRLNRERCTGCTACVTSCPSGTLEFRDEGKIRTFSYSLSRCICCGSCIKACPENAAEIRHEISPRNLFRPFSKNDIRHVELAVCEGCGALFAPELLLDRVSKTIVDDYSRYCSTCKKTELAANFYKLAPWPTRSWGDKK